MKKIELEYIPITEIIPYQNNPRKNDKAITIVEESIKKFGFKNPIIIDKNNEIIADKFNVFHSVDKIKDYRESNGMARPSGWEPMEDDDE